MYVLLCIHHSPLAVAEEQRGKCFVPPAFVPRRCRRGGRAAACTALETLKGLGLPIVYPYVGKGEFAFPDSVHHISARAAWTPALICSLLFLGSGRELIPLFSHLSGLPKMVQRPLLLPGGKGERWRRNS